MLRIYGKSKSLALYTFFFVSALLLGRYVVPRCKPTPKLSIGDHAAEISRLARWDHYEVIYTRDDGGGVVVFDLDGAPGDEVYFEKGQNETFVPLGQE